MKRPAFRRKALRLGHKLSRFQNKGEYSTCKCLECGETFVNLRGGSGMVESDLKRLCPVYANKIVQRFLKVKWVRCSNGLLNSMIEIHENYQQSKKVLK